MNGDVEMILTFLLYRIPSPFSRFFSSPRKKKSPGIFHFWWWKETIVFVWKFQWDIFGSFQPLCENILKTSRDILCPPGLSRSCQSMLSPLLIRNRKVISPRKAFFFAFLLQNLSTFRMKMNLGWMRRVVAKLVGDEDKMIKKDFWKKKLVNWVSRSSLFKLARCLKITEKGR